jgi:symplekin
LDLVVDAVMSNGAALSIDENHWYDRDGGHAWTIEEGEMDEDGQKELVFLCKTTDEKETTKFAEQSRIAASKAFSRILASTSSNRSDFAPRNPLISSCLEYDLNPPSGSVLKTKAAAELSGRVLNEMYVSSLALEEENVPPKKYYEECLDYYVSSVVDANNITTNNEKKRSANLAALALPHQLLTSPSLTADSLNSVASFCDIEEISKKAAKSKQSITESAALHAAKAAAEKRGKIAKLQCNLRSCFNVSLLSFSQPLLHCLFFVMLLFSVIMCVAMQ